MCRLVGYLGEPVTLAALLLEPEHSLLRQSWAPRHQTYGTLNADGFGAGWYALEVRPEPVVYRRAVPMWTDITFAGMAGGIRAGAIVAAVRSATPGFPVEDAATQPFTEGRYVFVHNGTVEGFRDGVGEQLRAGVSRERVGALGSTVDSELLFAMVMDRIAAGDEPGVALTGVIAAIKEVADARLTMLIADGERVWATCHANTLFTRARPEAVVVASEPYEDDPSWDPVADLSIVRATRDGVEVASL